MWPFVSALFHLTHAMFLEAVHVVLRVRTSVLSVPVLLRLLDVPLFVGPPVSRWAFAVFALCWLW